MKASSCRYQSAFSLVELSIVLVILGLLTGGILGGQALIRAAELRSIGTELDAHVTAVNTFRTKYFAIPGDMNNAERFWGSSTACSGGDAEGVCNGNGDGEIGNPAGAGNPGEAHQFWRHLSKAGLIKGDYVGIGGPTEVNGYGMMINENAPGAKIPNAIWFAIHRDLASLNTTTIDYQLDFGNHFMFGSYGYDQSVRSNPGVLTPEEAWNVDMKLDDGQPAKGRVIAVTWNNNCAQAIDGSSATNDFEAEYRLSDSRPLCTFKFRNYF
jgi:prepilin-type N-terminal cleavage/methylation domain-containing protein